MKTNKILCSLLVAASLVTNSLVASDLVVEEFGTAPAYSSIASAVSAATDGDRILVRNRAGNIPWIENITVDKSLEFLSYENDTFFVVQGNYSIDASAGRVVSIIGMKNLAGNILTGSSIGANKSTSVNIMDCYFTSGGIYLSQKPFFVTIAGSTLVNGVVAITSGSILGNSITNINSTSSEIVTVINNSAFQNDTVYIIGNKIRNAYQGAAAVYCSSTASILHIKNNFITHSYIGLQVTSCVNAAIANYIYNNTIWAENYNFTNYGIYISQFPAASITEIMNNVVDGNTSGNKNGIYASGISGQANAYFNHVDFSFNTPISGGFTFAGNNTTNLIVSFNITTGLLNIGDACIDGGNPANPFYDLDLTPGDAGAYGGSYSLANYFPLHSGAARIYSVSFPFNIRSGNTLNVKANAYDR